MMPENDSSKTNNQDYIVAIDIGTSEIRVSCAIIVAEGIIKIIGNGFCKTTGLSDQGITSIEKLKENISTAYNMAYYVVQSAFSTNNLANIERPRILVSIPGKFISYKNNVGSTELNQQPTSDMMMEKATSVAKSYTVKGYELITSIVNYYGVDDNHYVEDPIDMVGGQLNTYVHLVYAKKDFLDNLNRTITCVSSEYLPEFVFSGMASSYALTEEVDKKLGVCVLDIGSSSVDITVYDKNSVVYSGSSLLGARSVTRDISVLFALSEKAAEQVKCECGCATPDLVRDDGKVYKIEGIKGAESLTIDPKMLAEMIESKYFEIFRRAINKLNEIDASCELGKGFILTGEGAQMKGVEKCFTRFLMNNGMSHLANKVRIGKVDTTNITGYVDELEEHGASTVLGLIKFSEMLDTRTDQTKNYSGMFGCLYKMSDWFKQNI